MARFRKTLSALVLTFLFFSQFTGAASASITKEDFNTKAQGSLNEYDRQLNLITKNLYDMAIKNFSNNKCAGNVVVKGRDPRISEIFTAQAPAPIVEFFTGDPAIDWDEILAKYLLSLAKWFENERSILINYSITCGPNLGETSRTLSAKDTPKEANLFLKFIQDLREQQLILLKQGISKMYFNKFKTSLEIGYRLNSTLPTEPAYSSNHADNILNVEKYTQDWVKVNLYEYENLDPDRSTKRSQIQQPDGCLYKWKYTNEYVLIGTENCKEFDLNSFVGLLYNQKFLADRYNMNWQQAFDNKKFKCTGNCSGNSGPKTKKPEEIFFDPGSPESYKSEFAKLELAWKEWLPKAVAEISPDLLTYQTDSQTASACSSQASATKTDINRIKVAISATQDLYSQQLLNSDLRERKNELISLLLDLPYIEKSLNIWIEKLPIYFERDPKCTAYREFLDEARVLLTQVLELKKQLAKNNNSNAAFSTSKFNQTKYDKDSKKLDLVIDKIQASLPETSKTCVSRDGKKRIQVLQPKNCPSGYR